MAGLGVIFIFGIYFFVTYLLVKLAKPTWLKAVVLIVALLIPSVDAIYGRVKLKHMCEAGAGLKVNRVAEHVAGFMASTADESWIKQYGYQFSEGERTPKKYYRISKQDGQIIVEENVTPKSLYRIRLQHLDEEETYRRSQYLIEVISTSEILATDTQFGFNGGWAEKLIAAFSDGGINPTWCTTSEVEPVLWHKRIVLNTLKY